MQPEIILPSARSLVVAPRMPALPKERWSTSPFGEDGDIVVDCDTPGCNWHAMGTRRIIGKAVSDHRAMYHSSEMHVVLLNQPRQ